MRTFTILGIYTTQHVPVKFPRGTSFKGRIPSQAARKIFTRYLPRNKQRRKLFITIRETTAGSSKRMYKYEVSRHKLKQPLVRFPNTPKEFKIRYRTSVKSVAIGTKLTIGGMIIDHEDVSEMKPLHKRLYKKVKDISMKIGLEYYLLLTVLTTMYGFIGFPLWDGNLGKNILKQGREIPGEAIDTVATIWKEFRKYCSNRSTRCLPTIYEMYRDEEFYKSIIRNILLDIEEVIFENEMDKKYYNDLKQLLYKCTNRIINILTLSIDDVPSSHEYLAIAPPSHEYLAIAPPPMSDDLSFFERSVRSAERFMDITYGRDLIQSQHEDVEDIILTTAKNTAIRMRENFLREVNQTVEEDKIKMNFYIIVIYLFVVIKGFLFFWRRHRRNKSSMALIRPRPRQTRLLTDV